MGLYRNPFKDGVDVRISVIAEVHYCEVERVGWQGTTYIPCLTKS